MRRLLIGVILAIAVAGPVAAKDHGKAVVETLVKSSASWDGATLPAYPAGQPEITILKIQIPPGTVLPLHHHPVINAGVLTRGQLTVVTEKQETLHMKAGDVLVEVVGKWHYGKNEGNEMAEIVVFYAGITGTPMTVTQ